MVADTRARRRATKAGRTSLEAMSSRTEFARAGEAAPRVAARPTLTDPRTPIWQSLAHTTRAPRPTRSERAAYAPPASWRTLPAPTRTSRKLPAGIGAVPVCAGRRRSLAPGTTVTGVRSIGSTSGSMKAVQDGKGGGPLTRWQKRVPVWDAAPTRTVGAAATLLTRAARPMRSVPSIEPTAPTVTRDSARTVTPAIPKTA